MRRPWLTLAAASALLSACSSTRLAPPGSAEAELLAADRAFAADTEARRIEGWLAAFHPHGSQVEHDGRPITGPGAIRAHMGPFFEDPDNVLLWEPETALVSEAGNLGSTSGRFQLGRRRPDGSLEVQLSGRYFDIWRREPGGPWKLLYDVGEPDSAPVR